MAPVTLWVLLSLCCCAYAQTVSSDTFYDNAAWSSNTGSDDAFGTSMTALDYNNDGFMDLIVGAPLRGGSGDDLVGAFVIYRGSASGLQEASVQEIAGFESASRVRSRFGFALGTVWQSGADDLIVGSPSHGNLRSGAAYVYRGGSWASPVWSHVEDPVNYYAMFGAAVASGDLNNDGTPDLVVGMPGAEDYRGYVKVFLGSGSTYQSATVIKGPATAALRQGLFGRSVAVCDLNNDGYEDVVVGAPMGSSGADPSTGRVYVYLGGSSGINTSPAWNIGFGKTGSQFGYSVSCLTDRSDVNGDGITDVIVGAPHASSEFSDEGAVYIFRGGSTPPTSPMSVFYGKKQDALLGTSVTALGDVDNDGYADVAAAAPYYSSETEGRVYIIHGSSGGLESERRFIRAPTSPGDQRNVGFGYVAVGTGDINNDGLEDIAVGTSNPASAYVDEGPDTNYVALSATIRDFHYDWLDGSCKYGGSQITFDMVEDNLGPDKKPICTIKPAYESFCRGRGAGTTAQFNSGNTFQYWFNDAPVSTSAANGRNYKRQYTLYLQRVSTDPDSPDYQLFVYDSVDAPLGAFYPADAMVPSPDYDCTPNPWPPENENMACNPTQYPGWGPQDSRRPGRNFGFTTEIHTTFVYKGGEQFLFSGDDDVWVFIDGKLAVDVGGMHPRREGCIYLDEPAGGIPCTGASGSLNSQAHPLNYLVIGQRYDFDLFHAERCCCGSNFKITTTLSLSPNGGGRRLLSEESLVAEGHAVKRDESGRLQMKNPVSLEGDVSTRGRKNLDTRDLSVPSKAFTFHALPAATVIITSITASRSVVDPDATPQAVVVSLTNDGPAVDPNVVFTFDLCDGFTFSSSSGVSRGSVVSPASVPAGGVITWNVGSMSAGSTATATFNYVVAYSGAPVCENIALVTTSTRNFAVAAEKRKVHTTFMARDSNIQVNGASFNPATTAAGTSTLLGISLDNVGSTRVEYGVATAVVTFSSAVELDGDGSDVGVCTQSSATTISCALLSMDGGSSVTPQIRLRVADSAPAGDIDATIVVDLPGDTNNGNNNGAASLSVTQESACTVSSIVPASVAADTVSGFSVRVSNAGPSLAGDSDVTISIEANNTRDVVVTAEDYSCSVSLVAHNWEISCASTISLPVDAASATSILFVTFSTIRVFEPESPIRISGQVVCANDGAVVPEQSFSRTTTLLSPQTDCFTTNVLNLQPVGGTQEDAVFNFHNSGPTAAPYSILTVVIPANVATIARITTASASTVCNTTVDAVGTTLTCRRDNLGVPSRGGAFASTSVTARLVYSTFLDFRTDVQIESTIVCDADRDTSNNAYTRDLTIISPQVDCTGGVVMRRGLVSLGTGEIEASLSNFGPWEAPGGSFSIEFPLGIVSDVVPLNSSDSTGVQLRLQKQFDLSTAEYDFYAPEDRSVRCQLYNATDIRGVIASCATDVSMPPSTFAKGASVTFAVTSSNTDSVRTPIKLLGRADCSGNYPDTNTTNNDYNTTLFVFNGGVAPDAVVTDSEDPDKASDTVNLILIIIGIIVVCCCTAAAFKLGLFSKKPPPELKEDGGDLNVFGDEANDEGPRM